MEIYEEKTFFLTSFSKPMIDGTGLGTYFENRVARDETRKVSKGQCLEAL